MNIVTSTREVGFGLVLWLGLIWLYFVTPILPSGLTLRDTTESLGKGDSMAPDQICEHVTLKCQP